MKEVGGRRGVQVRRVRSAALRDFLGTAPGRGGVVHDQHGQHVGALGRVVAAADGFALALRLEFLQKGEHGDHLLIPQGQRRLHRLDLPVHFRLAPAPGVRLALVGRDGDDRLEHPAVGQEALLIRAAERIEHRGVDGPLGIGLQYLPELVLGDMALEEVDLRPLDGAARRPQAVQKAEPVFAHLGAEPRQGLPLVAVLGRISLQRRHEPGKHLFGGAKIVSARFAAILSSIIRHHESPVALALPGPAASADAGHPAAAEPLGAAERANRRDTT